ncbi:MAG: hypothetical protein A2096_13275 [Spirochaetes bacterium GWF1_41_5]|nr:MAG: hypothetical protein A2096_13275 [Spirochaetes bacterium GWF1_41_5]
MSAQLINHLNEFKKKDYSRIFQKKFLHYYPAFSIVNIEIPDFNSQSVLLKELASATDMALVNVAPQTQIAELAALGLIKPLDGFISGKHLHTAGHSKTIINGRRYAFHKNNTVGLFYARRDLLDRYGFDTPVSWAELIRQCLEINKNNEKPIQCLALRGKGEYWKVFLELLWSNNGRVFSNDGTLELHEQPVIETLTFLQDLIYRYRLLPLHCLQSENWNQNKDFLNGQYLFLQASSDFLFSLKKKYPRNMEQKIKIALLPLGPSGRTRAGYPEGSLYVVPARTRYPREAMALVNFFTNPDMCLKWENEFIFPFPRFRFAYSVFEKFPWYLRQGCRYLYDLDVPARDLTFNSAQIKIIEDSVLSCMRRERTPEESFKELRIRLSEESEKLFFSPLVQKARSLLRQSFEQDFRITDLARKCGVSRHHLSRSLRKETGKSPVQTLRDLRINKARELLVMNSMPVKSIAGLCGFKDLQYFFRVFRLSAGCTPAVFRQRYALK